MIGFGTFPSPIIPPCPLSCSTHHRSPHNHRPAFCRCIWNAGFWGSSLERQLPEGRLPWQPSVLHSPCWVPCSGWLLPVASSPQPGARGGGLTWPIWRRLATGGWSVRGVGSCGTSGGPELTWGSFRGPCSCAGSSPSALCVQDAVAKATSPRFLSCRAGKQTPAPVTRSPEEEAMHLSCCSPLSQVRSLQPHICTCAHQLLFFFF